MHHWTKRLFVLAAPLLLTGCLWGPGKFASDLTLKKDGSFVLDYRGEIVLQLPPDDDKASRGRIPMAQCARRMTARIVPCTKAEIATQKAEHDHEPQEAQGRRADGEDVRPSWPRR